MTSRWSVTRIGRRLERWTWRSVLGLSALAVSAEPVRVMTFNLWHGGDAGKQPLAQTLEVIRAAQPDLVGLQETGGFEKDGRRPDKGRRLAEMLGWNYVDQGERIGILTRFPVVTNTPRKWGVQVRLPSGRTAWMFNAHLMHAPYQPYQLLSIPYADGRFIRTAAEAVEEARKARGAQVGRLVAELKPALATGEPVFLTGDFNEPSHLDWTPRAAAAGLCPVAVEYPSTKAVADVGMRDAFRAVFPDEVNLPGRTWTPITRPDDPKDRHDRIDFVHFAGKGVEALKCAVVGESSANADIVVTPYPSDHRSVVATFEVGDAAASVSVPPMKSVALPKLDPVPLKPYAALEIPAHLEPSGLVKSRLWPDVYWSHNDSGDLPRIFAVHRDGRIYPSEREGAAHGVHIDDAVNVDWEDITADDQGNLIIADFGNSEKNDRRDLCLYWIREPHPSVGRTSVLKKVFFEYPDQTEVPSPVRNFDAEAVFFAHGHVYILTKHRSDTGTTLYRLDSMEPYVVNRLTLVDRFDTRGQVTGANASADGRTLAVLTYTGIWLFEAREKEKWFDGGVRWLPTEDDEAEAITIDGDKLIVSADEGEGDLYEIPVSKLVVVRP
jgi:endonuclease/exonuclease/phosphatase family metal-dependent hydrolase